MAIKHWILSALALFSASQSFAGSPCIFSGSDTKCLKSNIDLNSNVKILSGSADPTSSAQDAPKGSVYMSTNTGLFYRKTDSGSSTNFLALTNQAANESDLLENIGVSVSMASSSATIALKDYSGADPSSGSPVRIGFRNTTLATGQFVVGTGASSTSVVISNGSTIGSISGNASYIYVYALYVSSTIELAFSGSDTIDCSALVSSTAEGGAGAADAKATLYSTTARASVPCRLIARVTSTQATAGAWVTSPTQISLWPFNKIYDSPIIVDSGNGHGSTATKIRRWTNTRLNTGAGAIVYSDDSNNGGSFTIGEPGVYGFSCHDNLSSGTPVIGITVNDSATTTNISTPLTYAQGLRSYNQGCSACGTATSWSGKLAVGDIVRLHTNGNQNSTDASSMCTAAQLSR